MADIPNSRLYRFKEKCLRFRFQIQYVHGKYNATPDCMSRIFDNDEMYNVFESDNEVGAANVQEVYISKCKEDDQAVTLLEIV